MNCTLCGRDHGGLCDSKLWPRTADATVAVVIGTVEHDWKIWKELGCPKRLKNVPRADEKLAQSATGANVHGMAKHEAKVLKPKRKGVAKLRGQGNQRLFEMDAF